MIEPVRRSYSAEELMDKAKFWMTDNYGICRESSDQDKWNERYGLLLNFITDYFPLNTQGTGGRSLK